MLEVIFLSLIHVQLLKDVAVNSRRIYIVSSGIIPNWSCMCGLFLRWRVVASIFLKILCMHNKPLTDLFKKEKKSKNYTTFFHVLPTRTRFYLIARSSWCCSVFWQSQSYLSFFGKVDVEVDTTSRKAYCHHPLISQEQPLSMRILCYLFLKLTLWSLFLISKSDLYLMTDWWLF
jgi:hypothetical protein